MLSRRVAAPPFVQPKQHLATPGFRAIIRVFFVDDIFAFFGEDIFASFVG